MIGPGEETEEAVRCVEWLARPANRFHADPPLTLRRSVSQIRLFAKQVSRYCDKISIEPEFGQVSRFRYAASALMCLFAPLALAGATHPRIANRGTRSPHGRLPSVVG